jgi:phytoene dehydrogenase-like protein
MAEPEAFDALVIGAGLGGLTCAAFLARAGRRVLVLEKNRRIGGYAATYSIRGHRFDIATQALGGCGPGGHVASILGAIELTGAVGFLPCEPARAYYFAGEDSPYLQLGTWTAQLDLLSARFPAERARLETCYGIWTGILKELERIAVRPPGSSLFRFGRSYPLLHRYGRFTLEEFLDEQGIPGPLRPLLAARAGYCMLPPSQLSLVGFACTEMAYSDGAWMVRGGVGGLARAIAERIRSWGGSVERAAPVRSILSDGGGIRGVKTRDGRVFLARRVVAAADARKALEAWLDNPGLLPAGFLKRLGRMEPSGSYYIAYYRVPEGAVQGMYPNSEIHGAGPQSHSGSCPADVPTTCYLLIPSLVDRSSAPPGFHSLCLSAPLPPGRMPGRDKTKLRQHLEDMVIMRFPGLKGRLVHLFDLCPKQLGSMTGNTNGAAYGWSQTPGQSGIYRLRMKTPVPGLYLAGHWTMPGGGISGVMTSGRLCSGMILKENR